jgi:thiaminase (transcriptional activator TenA)
MSAISDSSSGPPRTAPDPSAGLAEQLWRANADLARAALNHPFVRGLGDGTLPLDRFQRYIAQDAYFLDAFARAYALALARSPDRESFDAFFRLLSGVIDELSLHAAYAQKWGVSLDAVTPHPATVAYTDFLLATASLRTPGEVCAAMAPCMRLYAYLGQSLARASVALEQNPYREWIESYASAEFEQLAATLEQLLDRLAIELVVRDGVIAAYRRAMQLEVAFFEASFAAAPLITSPTVSSP